MGSHSSGVKARKRGSQQIHKATGRTVKAILESLRYWRGMASEIERRDSITDQDRRRLDQCYEKVTDICFQLLPYQLPKLASVEHREDDEAKQLLADIRTKLLERETEGEWTQLPDEVRE